MKKKRSGFDKHHIVVIAVAAGLLLCIVLYLILGPFSKTSRHENKLENAETHYLSGEYAQALRELENAIELKETEEAYLLMAETYIAMGDIEHAESILRLAAMKFDSDAIDELLEQLQSDEPQTTPDAVGTVVIAGQEIRLDSKIVSITKTDLSDLSGLAQLTALESLTLNDNLIADLTPLAGLTSLSYLHLGNNNITDISPLKSLTALRSLYLDGNKIDNLSPLESMTSLTTLSLRNMELTREQLDLLERALPNCSIYCDEASVVEEITIGGITFFTDVTELDLRSLNITDISELAKCTKLTKLDLRENNISNLDALSGLTELSWLCLWNNEIEDVAALLPLNKLTYLDLDDNNVSNMAPLAGLENMEELWLSSNEPKNLNFLSSLPKLRRLGLKEIELTEENVDTLCKLTTLEELAIERNDISVEWLEKLQEALPDCTITHDEPYYTFTVGDTEYKSNDTDSISASGAELDTLDGIEHFKNLTSLNISSNQITDLSPLAPLSKLYYLDASNVYSTGGNRFADLSPLAGLTELRSLSLLKAGVTDISALSSLTNLTELILGFNEIGNISPLSGLTNLETLSLEGNGVADISALSNLHSLSYLGLTDNPVSDLTPLYGLSNLRELYISGCSVTAEQVIALQEALPKCNISSDLNLPDPAPEDTPAPEETPAPVTPSSL